MHFKHEYLCITPLLLLLKDATCFHLKMFRVLASSVSNFLYIAVICLLFFLQIENTKIEERKKLEEQDVDRLMKEKDRSDNEILALKEELEMARKTHEKHCLQLETQAKETKVELEKKLKELENLLTDSKKKVKELDAFSESKSRRWKRKELRYQNFVDSQFGALQVLIKCHALNIVLL